MIHATLIKYGAFQPYLMTNNKRGLDPDKLLRFIIDFLSKKDESIDANKIALDTDLIEYGIESITILTLFIEIEKEFDISLSLEQLDKCCYKFSVMTLLDTIDNS